MPCVLGDRESREREGEEPSLGGLLRFGEVVLRGVVFLLIHKINLEIASAGSVVDLHKPIAPIETPGSGEHLRAGGVGEDILRYVVGLYFAPHVSNINGALRGYTVLVCGIIVSVVAVGLDARAGIRNLDRREPRTDNRIRIEAENLLDETGIDLIYGRRAVGGASALDVDSGFPG